MGPRKHGEVRQNLRDALKAQRCQKQFKSKTGLNGHLRLSRAGSQQEGPAAGPGANAGEVPAQPLGCRDHQQLQEPPCRLASPPPRSKAPAPGQAPRHGAEGPWGAEQTLGGCTSLHSAQVPVFHLQDIVEAQLAGTGPSGGRKMTWCQ